MTYNQSFTVSYSHKTSPNRETAIDVEIHGVTSIMPNLDGLIFNTESGAVHGLSATDMKHGASIRIEYPDKEDFEFSLSKGKIYEETNRRGVRVTYVVHDERSKETK